MVVVDVDVDVVDDVADVLAVASVLNKGFDSYVASSHHQLLSLVTAQERDWGRERET